MLKNRAFYNTSFTTYYITLELLQWISLQQINSKTYYNTVLLYYLLCHMWGRGLHFRTCNRKSRTAYLLYPQTPYKIGISETFHPNQTQNTTSIHTSTKRPFYAIFTTSNIIKNHQYPTKNTIKALKIKLLSN